MKHKSKKSKPLGRELTPWCVVEVKILSKRCKSWEIIQHSDGRQRQPFNRNIGPRDLNGNCCKILEYLEETAYSKAHRRVFHDDYKILKLACDVTLS